MFGPSMDALSECAKFSDKIRYLSLLHTLPLPIVLKLRLTEAVPRGHTRMILATMDS